LRRDQSDEALTKSEAALAILRGMSMPHARFLDLLCPWPGCNFQIWFVDFQLELSDRSLYDRGIIAWEMGPGLTAR